MISYDIVQLCLFDISGHRTQMVKALVQLRVFRTLTCREHGIDLHRHDRRIHHPILCLTRMDVHTVHLKFCTTGVEILINDFRFIAAVQGISVICAKARDIKQVCAAADLLIRCKCNANLSVRTLSLHKLLHHGHDLCHPGLVICAKQRRTVRRDQRPPL